MAPMPRDWGRPPTKGGNSVVTTPSERMYEHRRPDARITDGVPSDLASLVKKHETRLTQEDDITDRAQQEADILALARQRFQTTLAAETKMRLEMVEDQRFFGGEQWSPKIKGDRSAEQRPVLTINRLPQFVKQITNPQRQSRPSIVVNPVSDGADKETAEIIQGIIRHIENTSNADVAYDEAYKDAVVTGRGWFRVLTDYVHDGTFEQEILVRRIPNPLSVYPDPSCLELDYSDARYMFIVEDIPKDEYRRIYGDASMSSLELFTGAGNRQPEWFPEGHVRVAEYFYVEEIERTIALIYGQNGEPLTVPLKHVPPGVEVERQRTVKDRIIHWVVMNGAEILKHKKWPGKWIPIIPVLGDEVHIDGERTLVGLVRYARDPQRMYNYWVSAETEAIALAPRAPYIGVEGQFKGHEVAWKKSSITNVPYLEYVAKSLDGKPAGPPQRQAIEPPIRAIVEAVKQADNDLKAVTGFYDASLGQPGPDQSGRAILARQKQGETANVNFIDNLGRSLWHAARVYLDLIPRVYDTERVVHIQGLDDQKKRVVINQDPELQLQQEGLKRVYDVRVGRYNVTMSIGPSYTTKRQEAVASMLELVKANPNLVGIIGDLMVGEMDWPMARQISARLKKMLPPQLQDQGDGEKPSEQQLEAMVAQLKTALQEKDQMLAEATEIIKTKKIETLSSEAQTAMQERTKLTIALTKLDANAAELRLQSELDGINNRLAMENQRVQDELADLRKLHGDMLRADQANQHAQEQAAQGAALAPPPAGGGPGGGAPPA